MDGVANAAAALYPPHRDRFYVGSGRTRIALQCLALAGFITYLPQIQPANSSSNSRERVSTWRAISALTNIDRTANGRRCGPLRHDIHARLRGGATGTPCAAWPIAYPRRRCGAAPP
jgi:hypothetical protein